MDGKLAGGRGGGLVLREGTPMGKPNRCVFT